MPLVEYWVHLPRVLLLLWEDWQYWVQADESGQPNKVHDMPEACVAEMVCDWRGAGRAQGYRNDALSWYKENSPKIVFSYSTRRLVERELGLRS